MKKFLVLLSILSLAILFGLNAGDSLATTTTSPSTGSWRCDDQTGVKDCYFSVPSPSSDYQAYRVTVQSFVDGIFDSDSSSILVEVCIAQTNSWPGSNPLACWTPIPKIWAQSPPIRVFPSVPNNHEVPMGNPNNPGNWANVHIRVNQVYSNTNVSVWGRRVSVDDFHADPSIIGAGQSTTLYWTVDWAESVTIDNGVGDFPGGFGITTGNAVVTPGNTTTYRILATGPGGAIGGGFDTSETTVTVNPPPTHLECVSNTCAEVSGAGDNLGGCITTGAACGGGGRLKCVNNACVFDPNDSGPNQCSTNVDCGGGGGCVSDGSCSAPTPACGTTTTGTDNCGTTCSKTGPACGGGGTGTVRIISNTNDGYFVDGPGADDWGWNGSADFPGHPTGTYSVNAPGGSSSPASQVLNSDATITFTVTFGGGPTPAPTLTPTPTPPGVSISSCTVTVLSPPAPNPPSSVSVVQPNYCVSGPAATVNWTYSDPSGSPQSAYQVQIDDQGSFQAPEWDSGKVFCSGCRANSTFQGLLQFNTTYKARVRVWNGYDLASGWTESNSFKTPNNAYPQVDFTFSPSNPPPNSQVQFTDQTQFFDGNPNGRRWSWLFGDSGSSTLQNPQHVYFQPNTYNATLTATDNANQSCSITKPVNVQLPNPIWKEVNPGG